MKRIAFIIAMQEEIEPLLKQLEYSKCENIKGFDVLFCTYKTLEIALIKCGIGKVNAAIATTLIDAAFSPDLVINVGSSAGLEASLMPGDIVIADELSYYDVDVTVFNYEMGQVPKMPAFYKADSPTLRFLKNLYKSIMAPAVKFGLILSGDSFLMCSKKILEIRKHFPTVHAVDMESTAIAQTCHRLGLPFLIIRSITDAGDHAAKEHHEKFLEFSQKKISDFITHFLDEMNEENLLSCVAAINGE